MYKRNISEKLLTIKKHTKNKEIQSINKSTFFISITLFFIIGFLFGSLLRILIKRDVTTDLKQIHEDGYEFINPLIDFETVQAASRKDITILYDETRDLINKKLSDQDITRISFYYKDLNSGAWVGINEHEDFAPASLLKVPLMIVCYKLAEDNPDFLKQQITYTEYEEFQQIYKPKQRLEIGKTYSLDEIIDQMILYSDNSALSNVLKALTEEQVYNIYQDLAFPNPYENENPNSITVKNYSGFFRILYNASCLNKDMSSKALKLLSKTEYDKGISQGIPDNIIISEKFGERVEKENNVNSLIQLHDCGIIYHPTKPYILCMMTEGKNIHSLEDTFRDISSIVYKNVNEHINK